MHNYIAADIKRIQKKKLFIGSVAIFIGLYLLILFIKSGSSYQAGQLMEDIHGLASWFPFIVGLPLFLSVFADDFKAKTMQVAIGFGLSRNRVILSKLVETIFLSLAVSILSIVVMGLAPLGIGIALTAAQIRTMVITILIEMLRLIGYISICLPFVFCAQNALGGLIVYVLMASKMAQLILPMLLDRDFITRIFGNISRYLLSLNLYAWEDQILSRGGITGSYIFVTALYILIPVLLAMRLFKNRELEF